MAHQERHHKLIDVTDVFARAIMDRKAWTVDRVARILDALLLAVPDAEVDWDRGAGEDWARVLRDGAVVALVHAHRPLAVVAAEHAEAAAPWLAPEDATLLVASDLDERVYRIDEAMLTRFVSGQVVPRSFDSSRFSINELWWATV